MKHLPYIFLILACACACTEPEAFDPEPDSPTRTLPDTATGRITITIYTEWAGEIKQYF